MELCQNFFKVVTVDQDRATIGERGTDLQYPPAFASAEISEEGNAERCLWVGGLAQGCGAGLDLKHDPSEVGRCAQAVSSLYVKTEAGIVGLW